MKHDLQKLIFLIELKNDGNLAVVCFVLFQNMGARLLKEQKMCIRKDCTKDVRPGTIYCSDDCISQHAQHSMKLIRQDRELIAISKVGSCYLME